MAFLKHEPNSATAILFVMTAYKGTYSFRGEQTSDIIKLLVREYVLIHTLVGSLTYLPSQRNYVLLRSVPPSSLAHSIANHVYPHI